MSCTYFIATNVRSNLGSSIVATATSVVLRTLLNHLSLHDMLSGSSFGVQATSSGQCQRTQTAGAFRCRIASRGHCEATCACSASDGAKMPMFFIYAGQDCYLTLSKYLRRSETERPAGPFKTWRRTDAGYVRALGREWLSAIPCARAQPNQIL